MDMNAIDIGTLLGSIAAVAKAFHSDSKASAIQVDRVKSKQGYDERFALLEEKVKNAEKRLDEGNDRFERFEIELKETNGLLRELIGMLKGKGVAI